VTFLGGDWDKEGLYKLFQVCKSYNLKTAMYSGDQPSMLQIYVNLLHPDYIKIGPFINECGGLSSPKTNQRFYKLSGNEYHDVTKIFHRM
jgi:anaerobic ribonucleoside-triphosphate reductase activating protein